MEITHIQKAPIDLENAKPIITDILSNQRRNQAVGDVVDNLRKKWPLSATATAA